MAANTLETWIAINARVGNGFSEVGATLTELGSIVDGMSQRLLEFGKESVEVYKDYEKSMREAEIALSTEYGRNTKELSAAMDTLNAKATEWAATTIFHTDDVADAIDQAAHAGWDLDEILTGMPVAMQLAQAGSMDLSEALTYITKSMRAFDVSNDELADFVDMWVYAANSSTGDVKDFGDAMKKMGATMRFTDSKEELFALIGLMHDMGESGSTAATLLRTSMMRLIAPSGVASKVMEQLGATDEEINEIREDASKMAALKTLEEHGFSAFKDDDQAKPILEMYADLGTVLAEIAGGYENITKNKTTAGILGTIFGTRGITGALDIVNGLQRAQELYESLREGKASGYGEYAAETMMDTLYGKTEMFESKMERLKQVVGEELSGRLEDLYGGLGNIVDNISGLDEGKMSALVSGLGVIAAAGPGLIAAGTFFRLLGMIMNPVTGVGMGLVALTAAAAAIKELEDYDFAQNFGNMEMDVSGITGHIQEISGGFREAWIYADQYQEALGKAVENYREASGTLGSNLFSMMMQNTKLTPNDLESLLNMADQMFEYAQQALYTAASGDAEYWTALFGGEEEAMNDPIYQSIIEKTNKAYEDNKDELAKIGEDMRKTITDAYTNDNNIDEDEYLEILDYFRKYNDMVARAAAEAQSEESRIQMRKWLLQAQTGSYDDIKTLAKTAVDERDALLQKEYDLYLDKKARLIEHGGSNEELQSADDHYAQRKREIDTAFDEFLFTLWDSNIAGQGQKENYERLSEIASAYQNGQLTADAANELLKVMGDSEYAGGNGRTSDRAMLGRMLGNAILSLGGAEGVSEKIADYEQQGNEVMAGRLRQLYTMEQLINNFGVPYTAPNIDWLDFLNLQADFLNSNMPSTDPTYRRAENREAFESTVPMGDMTAADAKQAIGLLGQSMESVYGLMTVIGNSIRGEEGFGTDAILNAQGRLDTVSRMMWDTIFNSLSSSYDIEKIAQDAGIAKDNAMSDYYAIWDLLYGNASKNTEQYRIQTPEAAAEPVATQTQKVEIEPTLKSEGAADSLAQLQEQDIQVTVTPDATELTATIDAADGQELLEYIDGDATNLHYAIMAEDGTMLVSHVDGDTSSLAAAIRALDGQTIKVYVKEEKVKDGFATGGRATEASIFGEAGPEWAIPEAHTDRTAELLNAARAASGFTWGELLDRFGGLNANPQNQPTTIVYSPTINAQNAEGVERVLQEDRARFEKWFEDKKMRDAAEVYT